MTSFTTPSAIAMLGAMLGAMAVATMGCGRGGDGESAGVAPADAGSDVATLDARPATAIVPDAGSVTTLVGEVHLHQLTGGSHAWTSFLGQGLPLLASEKDSITDIDTAPTQTLGPCTLYVDPTCTPDCAGAAYCYAPSSCQPIPKYDYVNGGEVDVTGSSVVPLIRMYWDEGADVYTSDPAPGTPTLFRGGDVLHLKGGMGGFTFEQNVEAPNPVRLTTPDPTTNLRLPDGALDVAWVADVSDSVEILLTAEDSAGETAQIRCIVPDDGSLTIDAELMKQLPAPPRQTTFQIVRNVLRIIPLAQTGEGIYMHTGQTTFLSGMN